MLNYECYKKAIRYNCAELMTAYNKLHLISFFVQRRTNYLKAMFMWMLRKYGYVPRHIAWDLMYKSTINLSKKKHGNLDSDHVNETINRYMKDYVINSKRTWNENSIVKRSRAFQLIQDFIEDFDVIINELEDQDLGYHYVDYQKYEMDIPNAAAILVKEKLVCGELPPIICYPSITSRSKLPPTSIASRQFPPIDCLLCSIASRINCLPHRLKIDCKTHESQLLGEPSDLLFL